MGDVQPTLTDSERFDQEEFLVEMSQTDSRTERPSFFLSFPLKINLIVQHLHLWFRNLKIKAGKVQTRFIFCHFNRVSRLELLPNE